MLRLFKALFKRKTQDEASSGNKAGKNKIKTAKAGSKVHVKEKSDTENEAEIEERIRSSALEIKNCIDLINSTGEEIPVKSKRGSGHAKNAGRAKNKRKRGKAAKKDKQGASPAEMITLLAKAEEKLSEAVMKAKENDDKKRDRKIKKR